MTETSYAERMDFADDEILMAATESVVSEPGDIDWYVTACPDGRWAAWDDADGSDYVEFFDARDEAIRCHRDGFDCADGLGEEHWVGPPVGEEKGERHD